MSTRTVLGFLLAVGMLFGIAYEPDAGTQASLGAPDLSGAVLGPNHAKPLPHVPSVADLLGLLGLGIAAFLTLVSVTSVGGRRDPASEGEAGRHRSVHRSPGRARRGPPLFA